MRSRLSNSVLQTWPYFSSSSHLSLPTEPSEKSFKLGTKPHHWHSPQDLVDQTDVELFVYCLIKLWELLERQIFVSPILKSHVHKRGAIFAIGENPQDLQYLILADYLPLGYFQKISLWVHLLSYKSSRESIGIHAFHWISLTAYASLCRSETTSQRHLSDLSWRSCRQHADKMLRIGP